MKRVLQPGDGAATSPYPHKRRRHESPSRSASLSAPIDSRTPASSHIEQWLSRAVSLSIVTTEDMDMPPPLLSQSNGSPSTKPSTRSSTRAVVQTSGPADPTCQEIRLWDTTPLLSWIQKKLEIPLKNDNAEKFSSAQIDGDVFLSVAGRKEFFQEAGIPLGPSFKLAQLAQTIVNRESPLGQRKRESSFDEGLGSRVKRTTVVQTAPSSLAKSSNYESLQQWPQEKILDDRPEEDGIPPISLLYDGFGQFFDIVSGATDIKAVADVKAFELELAVDEFAQSMCGFFGDEEMRREKGLSCLNKIFAAKKDTVHFTITAASIGPVRTDGHYTGGHGVATVISEFKNRSTGNTGNPEVELVGYFARSFAQGVEGQSTRLEAWRVPGLGITVVGPDIKFYAILSLGTQFRLVSLTPALSCICSASEGRDRSTLYRAFTAASVLQARILRETYHQSFTKDECVCLPGITELRKFESNDYLKFRIQQKVDNRRHYQLLYFATTHDQKLIMVKFVQKYCVELHNICAKSGHAPTLLAYERLPGAWYGIAMEYVANAVPITQDKNISKHFERWKTDLEEQVALFHKLGFVHGDLRDANIISTDDGCVRIVDFDWGGREGKALYPTSRLNSELVDGRRSEDLRITKEDDLRVLKNTLAKASAQV